MKLEILMSCMHQIDDRLIKQSKITGDVVSINQCDREAFEEYETLMGKARMFCTKQRGLTKSRNMAIEKSNADICLICDDDEVFVEGYEEIILGAYRKYPDADVIAFKVIDPRSKRSSLADKTIRLRFPKTMKISSWQISFRRQSLISKGIRFDERMGAGTGNGAEEELKFLTDCERASLVMYYVPVEIATVMQNESTWFKGYDESFFENRGATTRYILGPAIASVYAVYYVIRKKKMYCGDLQLRKALFAIFRGIRGNKIGKETMREREQVRTCKEKI